MKFICKAVFMVLPMARFPFILPCLTSSSSFSTPPPGSPSARLGGASSTFAAAPASPAGTAAAAGAADGVAGAAAAALAPTAAPAPILAIEGHPQHQWDQELLLQLAFMTLDGGGKGYLTPEEVSAVSHDSRVHALLSYTVLWASIKKRDWTFFQHMAGAAGAAGQQQHSMGVMLGGGGSLASLSISNNASAAGRRMAAVVTLQDWMAAAQGLSLELRVPLRHIRTQTEHIDICTPPPPPVPVSSSSSSGTVNANSRPNTLRGSAGRRGVGAANVFGGLPEREHRVARQLGIGDCVWALHNSGVLWLPAVVRAVHHSGNSVNNNNNNNNSSSSSGGAAALTHDTVSYSTYSYDLWYPLSQKELQRSRALTVSERLIE